VSFEVSAHLLAKMNPFWFHVENQQVYCKKMKKNVAMRYKYVTHVQLITNNDILDEGDNGNILNRINYLLYLISQQGK